MAQVDEERFAVANCTICGSVFRLHLDMVLGKLLCLPCCSVVEMTPEQFDAAAKYRAADEAHAQWSDSLDEESGELL